jgi:CDP-diacylglycerol--glycerol-3-phosphate 3-phosphatidyltransferase
MNNIKEQIGLSLHRAGISANSVTIVGLVIAFLSGVFSYKGLFFWAGALLLLSGLFDLLDGAVARASKKTGVFGGILDSSLDRYGDAFVFGGLVLFYAHIGNVLFTALSLSAITGSFAISYVRARTECVLPSCRVGYWERGERLVYLSLGLLTGNLPMALWVLGTMTHATVLYRLAYAASPKRFEGVLTGPARLDRFFADTRRSTPFYAAKTAFWLALLLVRFPA